MSKVTLTREDFSNKTEVRWCPGCGDYAILAALQRVLPELGRPPEEHVFVSGIGCAGRLPYYMNTYGFHAIHGRAMAVATGLNLMRDDVCVWVITGDGDALSIGGNHLIHGLRRNVNLNILMFNNQVYGLTKGQFSPTSPKGQITKTSPQGVANQPMNPLTLALGAGCGFVARAVDKDPAHLAEVIKLAYAHQGTSFIEIYQDCNIFNHGAFDEFALKANRAENTLVLRAGEPLRFGAENQWALTLEGEQFKRTEADTVDVAVHQPTNYFAACRLAQLTHPDYPVPLGVYYQQEREVFNLPGKLNKNSHDLRTLYRAKASWQID
jgi:2-oxoglutarate ferredoxin oxidoreductase subunit beta